MDLAAKVSITTAGTGRTRIVRDCQPNAGAARNALPERCVALKPGEVSDGR
jgi:hypothetical protein